MVKIYYLNFIDDRGGDRMVDLDEIDDDARSEVSGSTFRD
jgi:hypothetical protein